MPSLLPPGPSSHAFPLQSVLLVPLSLVQVVRERSTFVSRLLLSPHLRLFASTHPLLSNLPVTQTLSPVMYLLPGKRLFLSGPTKPASQGPSERVALATITFGGC